MSTIIKLRCVDQVLTFDSTPLIASGDVEVDRVEVDFCPKWNGMVKTATFWRNEEDAYHVMLDESDSCAIPPEVLIDEGSIYLGFFGVSADGRQRTSQVLRYNVVKGAITTDAAPDAPTADIYTQLLAKYLEMVQIATDTKTEVEQSQAAFEQKVEADQAAFEQKVEAGQAAFEKEIEDLIAAGLLPDGSVATAKLKDGAVTAAKLGSGAVTEAKIGSAAVTTAKLKDSAVTEAKLATAVKQKLGAKAEMALLWENASPTSNFSAQTIALDLSEYDYVFAQVRGSTTNNTVGIGLIRVGTSYAVFCNHGSNGASGTRVFNVSATGVEIGNGVNLQYEIPMFIIGIKGVQTA